MTKELARYFFRLIEEDLQFSFKGMGLPNNACEWLENQLMQENFDKVEEFIKKRYDEHENASKKKRKFRVMTFGEFCHKHRFCRQCPMYDKRIYGCITPYFKSNDPFRTKNGKYILVEVKK